MADYKPQKPRILVIDDEPFFLGLLSELLAPDYSVSIAKNGHQAISRTLGESPPDLVLLDIVMPEMDGYQVCRSIKYNPLSHEIPIIFLTASHDAEDEVKGLQLGAVDYITKPINPPVLLTRVKNHLALSQQRLALEQLVKERTQELERTKDAIVYSMGAMAEARDNETGNHLLRTREYVGLLARKLSQISRYSNQLSERLINVMERAAPLHDIGKIAVPEYILNKKTELIDEERRIMDRHPEYGKATIEEAESRIGSTPFIKIAKEIAYSHHEKWDGSGYPQGLQGEQIPLSARLMAVADVYDALVSSRSYKEALSHETSTSMIIEGRGSHFDPEVIDAFIGVEDSFREITQRYRN